MVLILAVFSLAGGVAAAVAGRDWEEQIQSWEDQGGDLNNRATRIPKNMAATAVSDYVTLQHTVWHLM